LRCFVGLLDDLHRNTARPVLASDS